MELISSNIPVFTLMYILNKELIPFMQAIFHFIIYKYKCLTRTEDYCGVHFHIYLLFNSDRGDSLFKATELLKIIRSFTSMKRPLKQFYFTLLQLQKDRKNLLKLIIGNSNDQHFLFSENRINMKNLKLLIELTLHGFFLPQRAFQNLNFCCNLFMW